MKNKDKIPVKLKTSYNLTIQDITSSGEGIAKLDGFTIFINNTVPGDKVKAKIIKIKSNYAIGKIEKFLQISQIRKEKEICQFCNQCGGCPYSNIHYEHQLKQKEKFLKDSLERIGHFKDLNILPIIPSQELNYRNKAQLKVNNSGVGFYQKGSHKIVNLNQCAIQQKEINNIIPLINKIIKEFKIPIYNENSQNGLLKGILIRTNYKGEILIAFILNGNKLPNQNEIVKILKENKNIISAYINENKSKGNRVLGNKNIVLFKKKDLIEKLGNKQFIISPTSFFQVNTSQAKILYDIVKKFADLNENDLLMDLYCGTGSIGIYIANKETNLIGIELNGEAIEDAKKNAQLNGLNNYQFYQGKAEEVINKLSQKPTCLILDPPRKGCDENLLNFILENKIPKIVYVSCNPTTLARDLTVLDHLYKIELIQPVDLFPQTGHIETVVKLLLKKK